MRQMCVMRIASLVPSATDVVAALGFADQLVGVSHECDHPAAAGRPILTASNVPTAPSVDPGEVDRSVSEAVAAGKSIYRANRRLLMELTPDVVLGQTICDVCAVAEPVARAALPAGAELINLQATTLSGLSKDLERVGQALGCGARAQALDEEIRRRVDGLARAKGPRVLTLEWGHPPFLGGHWVPELVEQVGGHHLLAAPGAASRRSTWTEIRAARPDVVIYLPCGYQLAEAEREARNIPELLALGVPVWATDATRLFSRCTPQAVMGGAQTLSAILSARPVDETYARRVA